MFCFKTKFSKRWRALAALGSYIKSKWNQISDEMSVCRLCCSVTKSRPNSLQPKVLQHTRLLFRCLPEFAQPHVHWVPDELILLFFLKMLFYKGLEIPFLLLFFFFPIPHLVIITWNSNYFTCKIIQGCFTWKMWGYSKVVYTLNSYQS